MAEDSGDTKKNPNLQFLAGELLKKAVTLGAGAYVSAEDKVNRTLNTVQTPLHLSKSMVKELLDSFIEAYNIEIKATISFSPKKKGETEK
jgi:hypothetical protein